MINGVIPIFSGAVCYLLVSIAFPRVSIKTSQTTRQESTPPLTIQIISVFFFQAEDAIRDVERSRGLGDVYKRQTVNHLLPQSLQVFPQT